MSEDNGEKCVYFLALIFHMLNCVPLYRQPADTATTYSNLQQQLQAALDNTLGV